MSVTTDRAARAIIEVDGADLDPLVEAAVEEVVVDDDLHRPDMFSIRLRDVALDVLTKGNFTIGAEITISGRDGQSSSPVVLIEGEITALEGDYYSGRAQSIVRGYDKSHRLHLGRRTATYVDETDADIAKEVAERAEIEVGDVESTDVTLPLVSQPNLTDWEFLQARADLYGFEVAVSEGKLAFRMPTSSDDAPDPGDVESTDARQLVFRRNLIEFRPRISAAGQVANVKVRGWDPVAKEELTGEAEPSAPSAGLSTTPTELAGTFGDPEFVMVDRALSTQAEVDAAAEALAQHIGTSFFEATGVAEGSPKLKAGVAVSVGGVAEMFVGPYTLTHTRHVFNQAGYRTHFEITGTQDRSLFGLVAGAGDMRRGPSGRPIFGMVTAIVTNNDGGDEHPAQVKLWFPWLSDKEGDGAYESDWARIVQLGAGPDSGAVWLPEVNDEVLVAFEHGDISHPYVIGGLYNGEDKPKLGDGLVKDDGTVKRRGFISRKGHSFIFFDDDSSTGIAMITADNKMKVSLNDTDNKLHVATTEGEILMEADKKDITISASMGKLKLSGKGGIEIGDGSSQVTIKGSTIALN